MVYGQLGHDTINVSASAGAAMLDGGDGDDTIAGSDWSDVIGGGAGRDSTGGGDEPEIAILAGQAGALYHGSIAYWPIGTDEQIEGLFAGEFFVKADGGFFVKADGGQFALAPANRSSDRPAWCPVPRATARQGFGAKHTRVFGD